MSADAHLGVGSGDTRAAREDRMNIAGEQRDRRRRPVPSSHRRGPGPADDQGRYPVPEHDAITRRQRLAAIDRNLDWVASCYGMR